MKKNKILYFSIIYFLFLGTVFAGAPETQQTYKKFIVNKDLTIHKIKEREKLINSDTYNPEHIKWMREKNDKMVFWTGTVINKYKIADNYLVILNVDSKYLVPVLMDKDFIYDRTGHMIGIKGRLKIINDSFYYLDLWSYLPLKPPATTSYYEFLKEYDIIENYCFNGKIIRDDFYPFLCWWIHFYNPDIEKNKLKEISSAIMYYCKVYKVDPSLAAALISVESAYRVEAVSPSGAIGLGQLMDFTAKELGVDPYDAIDNIKGSVKYLSRMLGYWESYSDKYSRGLASYNAGAGSVSYYSGIPPYSETVNYVYFVSFIKNQIDKQFRQIVKQNE